MRPWYKFCLESARAIMWTLGGAKGVHSERVPATGPVILAPIHLSVLDPAVVAMSQGRELSFMAKEELFKGLFGRLISSLGAFPVNRGSSETEAIRISMERLNAGGTLLVFPEGTRGDGVTLGEINRGVALFAKKSGAAVVAVGISGSEKILGRSKPRKRSKVIVTFSEPFHYADFATEGPEKVVREAFTKHLEQLMVQMANEAGLPIRLREP